MDQENGAPVPAEVVPNPEVRERLVPFARKDVLQARLALGNQALNQTNRNLGDIRPDDISSVTTPTDYLIQIRSKAERQEDAGNSSVTAWKEKLVTDLAIPETKQFFVDNEDGRRFQDVINNVFHVDVRNFTVADATKLYDKFCATGTGVTEFSKAVFDKYPNTHDGLQALENDLSAFKWIGNMLGKQTADVLVQQISLRKTAAVPEDKAEFIRRVNAGDGANKKINEPDTEEVALLNFLYGDGRDVHPAPPPMTTLPPRGNTPPPPPVWPLPPRPGETPPPPPVWPLPPRPGETPPPPPDAQPLPGHAAAPNDEPFDRGGFLGGIGRFIGGRRGNNPPVQPTPPPVGVNPDGNPIPPTANPADLPPVFTNPQPPDIQPRPADLQPVAVDPNESFDDGGVLGRLGRLVGRRGRNNPAGTPAQPLPVDLDDADDDDDAQLPPRPNADPPRIPPDVPALPFDDSVPFDNGGLIGRFRRGNNPAAVPAQPPAVDLDDDDDDAGPFTPRPRTGGTPLPPRPALPRGPFGSAYPSAPDTDDDDLGIFIPRRGPGGTPPPPPAFQLPPRSSENAGAAAFSFDDRDEEDIPLPFARPRLRADADPASGLIDTGTNIESAVPVTPEGIRRPNETAYGRFQSNEPVEDFNNVNLTRLPMEEITHEGITFEVSSHRDSENHISVTVLPDKEQDSVGVSKRPDGKINLVVTDGVTNTVAPIVASRLVRDVALEELEGNEPSSDIFKAAYDTLQNVDVQGMSKEYIDTRLAYYRQQAESRGIQPDNLLDPDIRMYNFIESQQLPLLQRGELSSTTLAMAQYDREGSSLKIGLKGDSKVVIFREGADPKIYELLKDSKQIRYNVPNIPYSSEGEQFEDIPLEENDVVLVMSDGIKNEWLTDINAEINRNRGNAHGEELDVIASDSVKDLLRINDADDDVSVIALQHIGARPSASTNTGAPEPITPAPFTPFEASAPAVEDETMYTPVTKTYDVNGTTHSVELITQTGGTDTLLATYLDTAAVLESGKPPMSIDQAQKMMVDYRQAIPFSKLPRLTSPRDRDLVNVMYDIYKDNEGPRIGDALVVAKKGTLDEAKYTVSLITKMMDDTPPNAVAMRIGEKTLTIKKFSDDQYGIIDPLNTANQGMTFTDRDRIIEQFSQQLVENDSFFLILRKKIIPGTGAPQVSGDGANSGSIGSSGEQPYPASLTEYTPSAASGVMGRLRNDLRQAASDGADSREELGDRLHGTIGKIQDIGANAPTIEDIEAELKQSETPVADQLGENNGDRLDSSLPPMDTPEQRLAFGRSLRDAVAPSEKSDVRSDVISPDGTYEEIITTPEGEKVSVGLVVASRSEDIVLASMLNALSLGEYYATPSLDMAKDTINSYEGNNADQGFIGDVAYSMRFINDIIGDNKNPLSNLFTVPIAPLVIDAQSTAVNLLTGLNSVNSKTLVLDSNKSGVTIKQLSNDRFILVNAEQKGIQELTREQTLGQLRKLVAYSTYQAFYLRNKSDAAPVQASESDVEAPTAQSSGELVDSSDPNAGRDIVNPLGYEDPSLYPFDPSLYPFGGNQPSSTGLSGDQSADERPYESPALGEPTVLDETIGAPATVDASLPAASNFEPVLPVLPKIPRPTKRGRIRGRQPYIPDQDEQGDGLPQRRRSLDMPPATTNELDDEPLTADSVNVAIEPPQETFEQAVSPATEAHTELPEAAEPASQNEDVTADEDAPVTQEDLEKLKAALTSHAGE